MSQNCGNCMWFQALGMEDDGFQDRCHYWPIPEASYNITEPMFTDRTSGTHCRCHKPAESVNPLAL